MAAVLVVLCDFCTIAILGEMPITYAHPLCNSHSKNSTDAYIWAMHTPYTNKWLHFSAIFAEPHHLQTFCKMAVITWKVHVLHQCTLAVQRCIRDWAIGKKILRSPAGMVTIKFQSESPTFNEMTWIMSPPFPCSWLPRRPLPTKGFLSWLSTLGWHGPSHCETSEKPDCNQVKKS